VKVEVRSPKSERNPKAEGRNYEDSHRRVGRAIPCAAGGTDLRFLHL
jgi:hypothetical protein